MSDTRWCDQADRDALASAVASALGQAIEAAVAARGIAVLALSGGNTPWPAYEALSNQPLAWDRVIFIPTDDRLVSLDDPLSNVAAVARIFEPLGAWVESLTNGAVADHVAAGQAADTRLRSLPWPLDFVLLGVGGDGHTASIFPGEDYAAAIDPCSSARALGVMPDPLPPEAPVARVSLSLAAISAARTVAIAATGPHKRAVIEDAIEARDRSPYPVGRVLAAIRAPVHIYWAPQ
ncbi:6-phosphogluconolactonase [Enhygromyxa salina]|uniref:6-phosphogluconolactonase n=1 Tax=Enhygromyxa salina TaxID=215803 RepID=A0A2S9Y0F6_9BACT|nr:6-phosphogluconolactonase [Enhygromyxa salina]PRP98584.1 6-phosphogluconolactonase [Enhygromyxa salina]